MIDKQRAPSCGQVRVTFELPACVWADRVHVVGDFNEWRQTDTPLKQDRDGVWRAQVDLPAGRQFEFRYLIDDKWHTDLHADGSRPNELGGDNSLLDTSLLSVKTMRQVAAGGVLVRDVLPRLAARTQRTPLHGTKRPDGESRAA